VCLFNDPHTYYAQCEEIFNSGENHSTRKTNFKNNAFKFKREWDIEFTTSKAPNIMTMLNHQNQFENHVQQKHFLSE
jgi:hypothetical protein